MLTYTDLYTNQVSHQTIGVPPPYDPTGPAPWQGVPIWGRSTQNITVTPSQDGMTATVTATGAHYNRNVTTGVHVYKDGQLYKCDYGYRLKFGTGSPVDLYPAPVCGPE